MARPTWRWLTTAVIASAFFLAMGTEVSLTRQTILPGRARTAFYCQMGSQLPTSMATAFSIFLGNGDGTFRAAGNFTLFGGGSPIGDGTMLAADFNQDGKIDLLVQFDDCRQRGCSQGATVFAGHGDGTFDTGHPFPMPGFN